MANNLYPRWVTGNVVGAVIGELRGPLRVASHESRVPVILGACKTTEGSLRGLRDPSLRSRTVPGRDS